MYKVVTTVPRARFNKYGVDFPAGSEVIYLDYPLPDDELIEACKNADFLFVGSTHEVNRNVLINTPSIRLLHVEGVGFDKIDTVAAKEMGLPVCNNRAVNNNSVAEHTIGLIIDGLRRISLADSQLKRISLADSDLKTRDYTDVQVEFRMQGVHELSARHVGLIGMGAIGRETARMLSVFGCRVSYYDAFRLPPEAEIRLNVSYMGFEELLRECDVISLHVPVLPDTINMIGAKQLALMQKTALLINTSRGEVLDQEALAHALEKGEIYGAAIDTISPEPPHRGHPLLNLSTEAAARLIITPHIAGTTDEAFNRMLKWSIANMQRVVDGLPPNNVVNGVEKARGNIAVLTQQAIV